MKKFVFVLSLALMAAMPLAAQSGLYVPSARPVKNMQKALTNPEVFCLLLKYGPEDSLYSVNDLDLLDSAYRIAFDSLNPMFYTMSIESFGNADEQLGRKRTDLVRRYFAGRCNALFPIRYALNHIRCSCHGDTTEMIRYEVPVTQQVYNCAELPEARRLLNKSIPLEGCVLVTFTNNPDECLGASRGCFMPASDSIVRGYYSWLSITRGCIYAVDNTKDTCPGPLNIQLEDHLNYRQVVEQYNLIPHPKQILVQAGYIVVKSNFARRIDECEVEQKDSIYIRIPATKEQVEGKLKFFAKVKGSRGVEYKALPTRKVPGKGELALQATISVAQFDTIYLGKRIKEDELKQYFFEVDSPTEAASFAVGSRFFVAYRIDKRGGYELRKALQDLFRNIPDDEEEEPVAKKPNKAPNPEEIID